MARCLLHATWGALSLYHQRGAIAREKGGGGGFTPSTAAKDTKFS